MLREFYSGTITEGLFFFLSGAWAADAPCPLRAGLTAGVAGGRRPPVKGAVRRPEAAGRPTGGYSGARAIGSSAPGPRAEPWPPSLIMRARSALTTCQLSAHAGRRRPPLRRAQRNTDVREKLTGCFTHDETEIQSYVQGVTGSISISTE